MVVVIVAASAVFAGAPETSLRPVARPDTPPALSPAPVATSAPVLITRPATRPAELAPRLAPDMDTAADSVLETTPSAADMAHPSGTRGASDDGAGAAAPDAKRVKQERGGLFSSLRPLLRPLAIGRKATKRKEARARGMVCGDPAIQGEDVGRVPGRITGCGVDSAVKVRSIDGVALSQHAVMDCRTASAIKTWIGKGMKPAVGGYGGGVAQLRVAAHYACRTRNNQRGAKVSEHGRGRAIDIAGFQMRDGRTITVLTDWGKGQKGQILSQMHRSACGPFGTVLGPNSDQFHRDHFHFDTARRRGSSYCR